MHQGHTRQHIDGDPDRGAGARYVIAGGTTGRQRLTVLSRVMADSTTSLFGRIGLQQDARVLDLGCGGGDVSRLFAASAPAGTVVGVDFDPQVIAIAAAETEAAGLHNIRYLTGDLTVASDVSAAIDELAPFDVVYARFLLSHLVEPTHLVDRMVGWCGDDGVVVCEDIDIAGSISVPALDAYEEVCSLYADTVRARGGDPQFGLALPAVLQRAGLRQVDANLVQPGGLRGDAKRIQLITLHSIAPRAVELGLTSSDRVAELAEALTAFVDRDDTFVTTARVVQAWGRPDR